MGIYIDGTMIVGSKLDKLAEDLYSEDAYEFAEDNGMTLASEWYDADYKGQYIGFKVANDVQENDLGDFLVEVKEAMKKFKEITNIEPRLIGMQDVW